MSSAGGSGGGRSGDRAGGLASRDTGPWVRPDGQWPLPWLDEPWRQAVSQRGHALLLHGPHGVGQFELALLMAQTWLCESPVVSPPGHKPCGRCEACHLLSAGVHPDLMVLTPESLRGELGLTPAGEEGADADSGGAGKPKSGGRDIRVADVRRAIDWGHQTSSRGRAKVLVLHPAQSLNLVAANALLKTLEEPAGVLRIVLSAGDPQALLPTLRSRCQQVALTLPPAELALSWLQSLGLEGADLLLQAAGGRPQEAVAMARQGLDARLWPEVPGLVQQGRAQMLQGLSVPRVIDALQKLCLDLMSRAQGVPAQYFPTESLPNGARMTELSAWWKQLLQAARHADHPWNASLLIESLVLQGCRCWPDRAAKSRVGRSSASPAGYAPDWAH